MPLLIAACSNRKRPRPEVRAGALAPAPIEAAGIEWLTRLAPTPRHRASALYCGRTVREAERAAKTLQADLLFASAGLGWVSADALVPSYGMTIIPGEDNVLARIEGGATAGTWWRWLNDHSPFATPLAEAVGATDGPVIVALPRPYLFMVESDLLSLPDDQRERLRIIQRGGTELASLLAWTLTYDDRLEADGGHAGTRSDFAARAARHFVERVLAGDERRDARAHAQAVEAALSRWEAAPRRSGERRNDSDLRRIVERHWDQAKGRTTRLLRILRDDLGIACEQGRFARLVAAMRAEREAMQ
jgi:hypothetical protein